MVFHNVLLDERKASSWHLALAFGLFIQVCLWNKASVPWRIVGGLRRANVQVINFSRHLGRSSVQFVSWIVAIISECTVVLALKHSSF